MQAFVAGEGQRPMSVALPLWHIGQVVILKKSHPCGGRYWTIYALGMEVGLQCQQCGQRIKLARRQFERAVDRQTLPQP